MFWLSISERCSRDLSGLTGRGRAEGDAFVPCAAPFSIGQNGPAVKCT
jgi:hypothetical protein